MLTLVTGNICKACLLGQSVNPLWSRLVTPIPGCTYACAQSLLCLTLCDPMDCSLLGSSVWNFPGKHTGVGCHVLLHGIFPTQGSNPCLLHWQVVSLPLSHLGSPWVLLGRLLKNTYARSHPSLSVLFAVTFWKAFKD